MEGVLREYIGCVGTCVPGLSVGRQKVCLPSDLGLFTLNTRISVYLRVLEVYLTADRVCAPRRPNTH